MGRTVPAAEFSFTGTPVVCVYNTADDKIADGFRQIFGIDGLQDKDKMLRFEHCYLPGKGPQLVTFSIIAPYLYGHTVPYMGYNDESLHDDQL